MTWKQGQRDVTLLALKMTEAMSHCVLSLEVEKDKEMGPLLEPPERNPTLLTLDFSPGPLM